MRWPALALAALPACQGATGTIILDLATAPGSTVLDGVERLRVTVTAPRRTFETERTADGGFDLALELDAGVTAALIVEGFDASGGLVATGMSPDIGFGPTDAHVVIYVAPPMSIAAAPDTLSPARFGISADTLIYGAVFAGGHDAQGVPSDRIEIYNAFDHTVVAGLPVPMPRTGVAIGSTPTGVYLMGGTDAAGAVSGALVRFDTTARPSGAFTDLGATPDLARTGERMVRIGSERFLITGAPPLELVNREVRPRSDLAALPTVGTSLPDASAALFVGGPTGLVRFAGERFDALPGEPARERAAVVARPSGELLVVGGGPPGEPTRAALLVDPTTGTVTSRADTLEVGRYSPAVAATTRHVVIAGGIDAAGTPIASAEVLDAATLELLATLPLAPRAGAVAIALSTGQVLVGGGDASPELLELFTPPPP